MNGVPYGELDPPIVGLVRTLNDLPGIATCSSCGGHDDPGPCGQPAHRWGVSFQVECDDTLRPTLEAWLTLEWLAWAYHDWLRAGRYVMLTCCSIPPFLNRPGDMIRFAFEGSRESEHGTEPDDLAAFIRDKFDELYVTAAELAA